MHLFIIHVFFSCFFYDQKPFTLKFNTDSLCIRRIDIVYIYTHYLLTYTHHISWPVAYRNIIRQTDCIIQFAYSMLNTMFCCLLSVCDIILFSSTHHGCLTAGQCSVFKSTTLRIALLVVKMCTDVCFQKRVTTCNTQTLLN